MSIFGHPEVYICTPFSLLFTSISVILSCFFCIKTLPRFIGGNIGRLRWDESHLKGPVNPKNSWQVTLHMGRLTNATRFADLPLDINFITSNRLFEWWVPTRMYWLSLITNSRYNNQPIYGARGPKYSFSVVRGNLGNPKGRNPHGSGDFVRKPGLRCFSSNSSISDLSQEFSCASLKALMEVNKKKPECTNDKLIHIVADPEMLLLSYELIKSSPGNSTPASDRLTLDGIESE